MENIIGVISLCVITEALVEYVKTLVDAFESKDIKNASIRLLALAVSVTLCLSAGIDMLALFGIRFGPGWVGPVFTGIFASRGANYMHDLIGKLQSAGADPRA